MKKKLIILAGMFILSQFSFSLSCLFRGYILENDKVYYESREKIQLEAADYKSFEIISSVNYSLLAKDTNNVYYQGKILENINPETFKIIEEIKPAIRPVWGYGCGSSGYILEDKGIRYEVKEVL